MDACVPDHEGTSSQGPTSEAGEGEAAGPRAAGKSSGRRRTPSAAAVAASEQAASADADGSPKGKVKTRLRKVVDAGNASRTHHGGVKIGGRAVTWVGGAGMPREVLDKMGIPQLRALFLKTFNHPTGSNNAEWLRKKLAQPQDPEVGAARAAVPRARDVGAEIWSTGTAFKGFTKQERSKLAQMGGNCAAKVVEVIRDPVPVAEPQAAPKKRRRTQITDSTKMRVIGAEEFNLPPPRRVRGTDEGPVPSADAADVASGDVAASAAGGGNVAATGDVSGGSQCCAEAALPVPITTQSFAPEAEFRMLTTASAPLLQVGVRVKVYRADERWHEGTLENISYVDGSHELQNMLVTIYYFEHDQEEERPLSEFFRGENSSLIQWQPVSAPAVLPVSGLHLPAVALSTGLTLPQRGSIAVSRSDVSSLENVCSGFRVVR